MNRLNIVLSLDTLGQEREGNYCPLFLFGIAVTLAARRICRGSGDLSKILRAAARVTIIPRY